MSRSFAVECVHEMLREKAPNAIGQVSADSIYQDEFDDITDDMLDELCKSMRIAGQRGRWGNEEEEWYSDRSTLRRFLVARKGNLSEAQKLLGKALAWRHKRKPNRLRITPDDEWNFKHENRTGPTLSTHARAQLRARTNTHPFLRTRPHTPPYPCPCAGKIRIAPEPDRFGRVSETTWIQP